MGLDSLSRGYWVMLDIDDVLIEMHSFGFEVWDTEQ